MKCLITHIANGVIMDHIVTVEAELLYKAAVKYDKLVKMLRYKDTEWVVVAKDINGNIILLGEYTDVQTLVGLVPNIMNWASDPEDTKAFTMPHYDGDK